jgi:hypothetical protein
VPRDVFEEYPFGLHFPDDAGDVGPEVAGIVGTLALSCGAERLAGVSGKDGVDRAPQLPPVKAGDIIPDGSRGEVSGALSCDDCGSGMFFPFDKASGVGIRLGQHEAHIKATGARAKREAVSGGVYTHVIHPAPPFP